MTKIKALVAATVLVSGGVAYYGFRDAGLGEEIKYIVPEQAQEHASTITKSGQIGNIQYIGLSGEEEEMMMSLIEAEYETKTIRGEEEKEKQTAKKKEVVIF